MGAEPKLQRELGNPIEQLGGGPEPKTKENGAGPETETYFGPNRLEEGQLTGNRKIAPLLNIVLIDSKLAIPLKMFDMKVGTCVVCSPY